MAKKNKSKDDGDKGGVELKDGEIKTPVFRVGFLALPDEDGYFACTAIFPEDTNLKEMEKLAKKTLKAKFGDDIEMDDYSWPIHDGSKRARKKDQPQFENSNYCNIKSRYAPIVLDENGNELELNDTTELYSGMYCRAVITAYGYENKDNDGVSFGLQAMQKLKDGKKIGGAGMSKAKARALFSDSVDTDGFGEPEEKGKGKKNKKKDKTDKKTKPNKKKK